MRMVEIETKKGTMLINPKQITSISNSEWKGVVIISMSDGQVIISTEFNTMEDAFGYIKEGANYSTKFTRRMDAEMVKYKQFNGESQ